jgi:hypothetical protein
MKRLLEDSLPGRTATLLRSAASDVPPRIDEEKARLRSVVSASAARTSARSSLLSGKWLGLLSLVVATTGLAGSGYVFSSASQAPHVSQTVEAPSTPAAPIAQAAPLAAAAMESDVPAALPSAPARPEGIAVKDLPTASNNRVALPKPHPLPSAEAPAAVAATPTSMRPSEGAPRLEDELKAVDDARAAFVDHQPSLALNRVETYRHRFPSGHFTAEIDALEIQALAALDRNDEARAKAARFIAEHPESPYAQRVRSAVSAKK